MFKRPINFILLKVFKKQYNDSINVENISHLSSLKIYLIFRKEKKDIKNIFLHNLISEWWNKQEESEVSFKYLKRIIFKTRIELNVLEKHNLLLVEERIFSIDRHIKRLEVDNELLPKEFVGAKFKNAKLFVNKEVLTKKHEGDLLITNFRIIISNKKEVDFSWKNIKNIKYFDYGFSFSVKNVSYLIRIHDQITLNNTIKNLYERLIKKWLA